MFKSEHNAVQKCTFQLFYNDRQHIMFILEQHYGQFCTKKYMLKQYVICIIYSLCSLLVT